MPLAGSHGVWTPKKCFLTVNAAGIHKRSATLKCICYLGVAE